MVLGSRHTAIPQETAFLVDEGVDEERHEIVVVKDAPLTSDEQLFYQLQLNQKTDGMGETASSSGESSSADEVVEEASSGLHAMPEESVVNKFDFSTKIK